MTRAIASIRPVPCAEPQRLSHWPALVVALLYLAISAIFRWYILLAA